jgi:hypothetical protein
VLKSGTREDPVLRKKIVSRSGVGGSGGKAVTDASDYPYVYRWNPARRKGALCKVTARGTFNSARVEFEDGFVMITSRNALKRAEPRQKAPKLPRPNPMCRWRVRRIGTFGIRPRFPARSPPCAVNH